MTRRLGVASGIPGLKNADDVKQVDMTRDVLSLGWGRQSFTIAAMSVLGELPMPDIAIFADTGFESERTYEFAGKWTPWLESHGLKVVTVKESRNRVIGSSGKSVLIPAHVSGGGLFKRRCTWKWKIKPIRRWLSSWSCGWPMRMWLGITTDEFQRVTDSKYKRTTNHYPLLDMKFSRVDCERWLKEAGLPVPPKSSCVFCPFRSVGSWIEMARLNGTDWKQAIDVDESIRDMPKTGKMFLHPRLIPLKEIDISEDYDSSESWSMNDECTGYCGV